jgi:hypothetical protein
MSPFSLPIGCGQYLCRYEECILGPAPLESGFKPKSEGVNVLESWKELRDAGEGNDAVSDPRRQGALKVLGGRNSFHPWR